VAECKDVIGETGRIGEVFLNPKIRFVVQQTVENVGGITCIRSNDLAVEGGVLVGDMRVNNTPGSLP